MNKDFSYYLSKFLKDYLIIERNMSLHTVRSYKKTFQTLIEYLVKIKEFKLKDITFNMPEKQDNIKEDVTFEMPVLTKNLENFKKNLEEEIQNEEIAEVRKTSGIIKHKEPKATKILDINAIEDTSIIPNVKKEENVEVLTLNQEEKK